jgi:hypothetical protein
MGNSGLVLGAAGGENDRIVDPSYELENDANN